MTISSTKKSGKDIRVRSVYIVIVIEVALAGRSSTTIGATMIGGIHSKIVAIYITVLIKITSTSERSIYFKRSD